MLPKSETNGATRQAILNDAIHWKVDAINVQIRS